jgi:hypothetical protein
VSPILTRQIIAPGRGLITRRQRPQGGSGPPAFAPEQLLTDYGEASDLAIGDATLISSWPLRNGVSTLTQPGASNLRPTYRADDGSGFASAQFDGTDDWLIMDSAMVEALASGLATFVLVWESLSTLTSRYPWTVGASTSTARFAGLRSGTALDTYIRLQLAAAANFVASGANGGDADYSILEYDVLAATGLARMERAAGNALDIVTAQTIPDGLIDQGAIGCLYRTTTQAGFAMMRIRAIGYINRLLTAPEIALLRAYFTTRFGY